MNDRQPNFLFLFPDQWRWDWLGCAGYGIPVRTPNLDALAARGVRFTQCRSNAPICAPARAALVSGKRMHRTGVPENGFELDPSHRTLMHVLREAGYQVAATGKTDLTKHASHKGLDGWKPALGRLGFTLAVNQCGKRAAAQIGADQPRDPYMRHLHQLNLAQTFVKDYAQRPNVGKKYPKARLSAQPSPLPRQHCMDDFCGQMTLRTLDQLPVGEPWYLWVNFPGPHEPFDPPQELLQRYDGVTFALPVDAAAGSEQDHQQLRRNYAAMIEGIDEWVGWIIQKVEERGEADNTIIVFSSDHGEMLGDHGRWNKSVAYEGSVHVPLIVAGPGLRRGATSDALVELIDLAATMVDLAGLDMPQEWDARSLASVLRGNAADSAHRDVQVAQLHDWRMACDGRWKLVESTSSPCALFDLAADPGETRNVFHEDQTNARRLAQALGRQLGDAFT